MDSPIRTIKFDEVGVEVFIDDLKELFDRTPSGTFCCIRGYMPQTKAAKEKDGGSPKQEIADYFVQHGISYESVKDKSRKQLAMIESGENRFQLSLSHGVWIDKDILSRLGTGAVDPDGVRVEIEYEPEINGVRLPKTTKTVSVDLGVFGNRKSKGGKSVQARISYVLDSMSPQVADAIAKIRESFDHPRPQTARYSVLAKGLHSLEVEEEETFIDENGVERRKPKLYIRDCLVIHKHVRQKAEREFEASLPKNAIADAVRRKLMIGRYREFKLDKDHLWEAFTLGGQSVMLGVEADFYFACPEDYKEAFKAFDRENAVLEDAEELVDAASEPSMG